MKRWILFLAALVFTLECIFSGASAVSTCASSSILMDVDSGRILFGENIHEKRLIASITKLLTALVAVENTPDLDKKIVITPECTGIEGSSVYLQAGETMTMRELLYGLLLQSGNDAAAAIAVNVSGDVNSFVELMNQRAAELGMNDSHFVNPSGLNDDNHYSTAYDMALLACACLENTVVANVCSTKVATAGNRTFVNHNKLLTRYDGCIGMKTGYTEHAGRTLVSAARRNGRTLVCVTLNDGNDWNDHETLLNYGFNNYRLETLCLEGDVMGVIPLRGSLIPVIPVVPAQKLVFPLAENERLDLEISIKDGVEAPAQKGQIVGLATWSLEGIPVAEVNLVCAFRGNNDILSNESGWNRIKQLIFQLAAGRIYNGRATSKNNFCCRDLLSQKSGRDA